MHRRLRAVRKRQIAGIVILAGFGIIGLVYSDAMQLNNRVHQPTARAEVPGIAAIAKPFSFANSTAREPAPRVVIVSAENILPAEIGSPENPDRNQELIQTWGDARSAQVWPQPQTRGASRPNMLYLRRSLPTFGQTRSAYPPVPSGGLLAASAARYLDTPFNSLLESVFRHSNEEAGPFTDSSKQQQELRNPFSDAKQKADAESASSAAAAAAPPASAPAKDTPPPTDQNAKNTASNNQTATAGGSPPQAAPEGPFLILGDFTGSGVLETRSASRIDDGTFAFRDGQRTFSLYINPAAVELQRSFAVDDFNSDGAADMLVTSRAALFGGVLLGDGNGNYQLSDTFVTGYEPTVPVPGLLGSGYREILSVNVRTGLVQTFRRADSYRAVRGQAVVNFIPDFVARVTKIESGDDCFIAAQSGKAAAVYQWGSDGSLSPSGDSIPPAPSISIYKDFLQESALGNLQVYQVGSSASVLLTNGRGASFNVANFKVFPGLFLMVGDISKRGTLDVAIAYLLSSTPAK